MEKYGVAFRLKENRDGIKDLVFPDLFNREAEAWMAEREAMRQPNRVRTPNERFSDLKESIALLKALLTIGELYECKIEDGETFRVGERLYENK